MNSLIGMISEGRSKAVIQLLGKCAILLAFFLSTTPTMSSELSGPEAVVNEYCLKDARGARLSSKTYPQMRILMAWEDDRDEPGWDRLKVIQGFKVLNGKISGDLAVVTVQYEILGELLGFEFVPSKETEFVEVKLTKKPQGWRLQQPVSIPRVSLRSADEISKEHPRLGQLLQKIKLLEEESGSTETPR